LKIINNQSIEKFAQKAEKECENHKFALHHTYNFH